MQNQTVLNKNTGVQLNVHRSHQLFIDYISCTNLHVGLIA